jgi:DNA polymerase III delta subunit
VITLFFGENSFEIDNRVKALIAEYAGEVERIDGGELSPEQLPEVLTGTTLFSSQRLVIIKGASGDRPVWAALGGWLERGISNDLVLIEPSVDKRTKTYKWLQKNAQVVECTPWRDYEFGKARAWLRAYAKEYSVTLTSDIEQAMVERAVVADESGKAIIDQALLANAVEQLTGAKEVTMEALNAVLPTSSYGNVFQLLECALSGQTGEVRDLVQALRLRDDAHMVAAVLSSQAVNLVALSLARDAGVSTAQVAKDIGVHPYALSQMEKLVDKSHRKISQIVDELTELDTALKTSAGDSWQRVEVALLRLSKK